MSGQLPVDTDVVLGEDGEKLSQADIAKAIREKHDERFLALAHSNFLNARSYQDASLIVQWERNADHFNSRHFRRSTYNSPLYRGRSRLFRPMTRAAERSSSAQFAAAMFSNMDVVEIKPLNQNDAFQVAAARMMKQVMQYRLKHSIKWYLTCMGAWQDTRVYGPCWTYTYWEYEKRTAEINEPDPDNPGMTKVVEREVIIKDQPVIDMIPPENMLVDAACDWRDPVGTSPFLVRLVPMYVVDVLARMDKKHIKTGEPEWHTLTKEQILSAERDTYNTVRQAREGDNRPDKTDNATVDDFKIVWPHENFVRIDGVEMVYWTLSTQFMLTDPVPLTKAYAAGKRPVSYGFSVIETHKFSPSSTTELIANLQAGVNDIANLRIDNVRLALNKRYILRRGAVVDLEALMASVPGGGIMTEDPERDVKVLETRDVTGSSYKEQERLETEANDITGTFMGSSVQNNRSLNETVGGMEMLAEGSNAISEMDIRTFAETWVEDVLTQLMVQIQAYESDSVIFDNAFEDVSEEFSFLRQDDNGNAHDEETQKEIKDNVVRRLLKDQLTLKVNVGMGATSPQRKADNLNTTVGVIASNPDQAARIDWDEISKEQFANAGFQDGARFLIQQDDTELTQEDVDKAYEQGAEEATDKLKQQELEMREKVDMARIESQERVGMAKIALEEGITMASLEMKLGLETMKDKSKREATAISEGNKANELEYKRTTGKPGI